MEEFKKYFKFPLKMWEHFTGKVFTQENNMAFDWLLPWGEEYNNLKQRHLDKINGLESNVPKEGITYIHKEGRIIAKMDDGSELGIALIRGWGMLTGVGGYNLPSDKAAEIQDAFADYCVEMLNKK
jgi:hypothetical protein